MNKQSAEGEAVRVQHPVWQWHRIATKPVPETGLVLLLDDFGPQVWDAGQYHRAMKIDARSGLPKKEAESCFMWAAIHLPNAG